jgi:hypothetical protein
MFENAEAGGREFAVRVEQGIILGDVLPRVALHVMKLTRG